jgi:hypothetical protein
MWFHKSRLRSLLWKATAISRVMWFQPCNQAVEIGRFRDANKAKMSASCIKPSGGGYIAIVTRSWLFDLFR